MGRLEVRHVANSENVLLATDFDRQFADIAGDEDLTVETQRASRSHGRFQCDSPDLHLPSDEFSGESLELAR